MAVLCGLPPPDLRAARGLPASSRPWLLCAPVGGGPPARSPHASFARSGRSRGPPWPCRHPPTPQPPHPARLAPPSSRAAVRCLPCHHPPAPQPLPLQQASHHPPVGRPLPSQPCRRPPAPQPPTQQASRRPPSGPAKGLLRHMKPSTGVSPACRSPNDAIPPVACELGGTDSALPQVSHTTDAVFSSQSDAMTSMCG